MNMVREHHRRSIGKLFHRTRVFIGEMNQIADATCTIGLNRAHGGVEVWRPATEIFARDNDMVVRCDLTGVRPEDVDITFTEERLTITGTKRPESNQGVVRRTGSRSGGDFRRDISLCSGLSQDDVRAMFDEGILEITLAEAALPKSSQATPISLNAAGRVPDPREPVAQESELGVSQQA